MLEVMCLVNEGNFYAAVCCIMFQLGTASVSPLVGGLCPAVGMHTVGQEVRLFVGLNWLPEEDSLMSVDMNEEELCCDSDIWLNGQVCCEHCCRQQFGCY
jgi:hypothetical protein